MNNLSTENPLISIIVNCRNSEKYISECIESVQNQTYGRFELIIYDNFSNDKTKFIVKNLAKNDVRIKYFRSECILSLGSARNTAMTLCTGEMVAFLDSDDLWDKHKLEQQVKNICSNENIGFCFATTVNFNNSMSLSKQREISRKIAQHNFRDPQANFHFKRLLVSNYIGISGLLFRKKLISKVGNFSCELEHAEDYDFILRLALRTKGIRSGVVFYRFHESNLSKSQFHISYLETLLILNKYSNFFNAQIIKRMVIFRYLLGSIKKREYDIFCESFNFTVKFLINLFIGFHIHVFFSIKNKLSGSFFSLR